MGYSLVQTVVVAGMNRKVILVSTSVGVALAVIIILIASALARPSAATAAFSEIRFASGVGEEVNFAAPNAPSQGRLPAHEGGLRAGGLTMTVLSRVPDTRVDSITIAAETRLDLRLLFKGAGSPPAVATVVISGGLSGSNTISNWSSPSLISINLAGKGSLNQARHVIILIVPFTR